MHAQTKSTYVDKEEMRSIKVHVRSPFPPTVLSTGGYRFEVAHSDILGVQTGNPNEPA